MKSFTIVLLLFVQATQSQSDDIESILAKYDDIKDAYEFSKFYRSLFAASKQSQLVALNSNANDSIATQSAWETVNLTVPQEFGPKVYRPDEKKLVWFIGFFEGRNRVAVPDWWRTVVVDARANRRNNIYPGEPIKRPYHWSTIESVACPTDAMVTEKDHVVTYRTGSDSIVVPEELLVRAKSGQLYCDMSCASRRSNALLQHTGMLVFHTRWHASTARRVKSLGSLRPVVAIGAELLAITNPGWPLSQRMMDASLFLVLQPWAFMAMDSIRQTEKRSFGFQPTTEISRRNDRSAPRRCVLRQNLGREQRLKSAD